jgi:uncharacterized protein (TIGR02588 family)
MTNTSGHSHIENAEPHWIEWLTGAISAAIVIGLVAWIGKDALIDRDDSPDLQAAVVRTEQRSNGFQVLFEMANRASATASDVTVRGELRNGEQVIENAETLLSYVPGRSRTKGGLIFQNDPAGKTVMIRESAYNEP